MDTRYSKDGRTFFFWGGGGQRALSTKRPRSRGTNEADEIERESAKGQVSKARYSVSTLLASCLDWIPSQSDEI